MDTLPVTPDALREAYATFVTQHGQWKAVIEMSARYGISPETLRRRLAGAGVRLIRKKPLRPSVADLEAAYLSVIAKQGQRGSTGKLAAAYGVTTTTIRKWLTEGGLYDATPRIPPRPITESCPCGAIATTRYKGQDPAFCARCYMRTYAADGTSPFRRLARDYIAEVKMAAVCADCDGRYPPCVYHFDHVPGRGPKLFNVANCDVSLERLKAEIAKCDIVCANCHAIHTWVTREKHWIGERRLPGENYAQVSA